MGEYPSQGPGLLGQPMWQRSDMPLHDITSNIIHRRRGLQPLMPFPPAPDWSKWGQALVVQFLQQKQNQNELVPFSGSGFSSEHNSTQSDLSDCPIQTASNGYSEIALSYHWSLRDCFISGWMCEGRSKGRDVVFAWKMSSYHLFYGCFWIRFGYVCITW